MIALRTILAATALSVILAGAASAQVGRNSKAGSAGGPAGASPQGMMMRQDGMRPSRMRPMRPMRSQRVTRPRGTPNSPNR